MLGRGKELAHVPKMIKTMTNGARRYFYDQKTGLFTGIENKQVSFHYIQALTHCSMNREAKGAMIEYWGNMVHKGPTLSGRLMTLKTTLFHLLSHEQLLPCMELHTCLLH
jgi:hypothetical protein